MFAKIVGLPIRAASFAGEHNHRTGIDAVEVVKQMAGLYPDGVIASTLNRLGFNYRLWQYLEEASGVLLTKQTRSADL